ncbi:murein transglycosylase A [Sulfuricystis multivorans]|uniref:murein transglycosylase A n=1 Tax=Sulfuricystis multivorans TaxID=2211108 RepID=UPI0015587B95|nr:MltA domain-containing protein [Sulfuricystis multivorans]
MKLWNLALLVWLAGCAIAPAPTTCPPCPGVVTPAPAEKPLQPANWAELPGWEGEDHAAVLALFKAQCVTLAKRPLWLSTCESAQKVGAGMTAPGAAKAWFEANFRPWALVNPDGSREGLITGYYEPVVRGSRTKKAPYLTPVFGPPEDLIIVDLSSLYPELKNLRLRGRLEGRRLIPYFSRAEWAAEEDKRADRALMWVDDPIDFFFLQIQGSGQVVLDDGSRVRIGYADQNGHPYRSIGRWLIEQNELKPHEASMQGIKAWAERHPERLRELLEVNPSLIFFRELPIDGSGPPGEIGKGPPGALGVPLTPERSIAVDPRFIPLGAPVWLATTRPNDLETLARLMLAQDTGGAIRGPVRADFFWGSGPEAGSLAGRMRQKGKMWVMLPRWYEP